MGQIADIIKYEGNNQTFVWKHPLEDFNSLSQLIVHESQEAVFFMNGQALDLFGPGRYTLETENIPMVGRVLGRTTGDKTPFHCEVYFINKADQMAIKWGTDSKVQFMEPTYNFPISIGASGEMVLKVEDSRKLLTKLIGTEEFFTQQTMTQYFRGILSANIKAYLAKAVKEKKISIFEIDEHLLEISNDLWQMLVPEFSKYGLKLVKFIVTTIVKPDGEAAYEKFKSLHFRQYADIAEAQLRQRVSVIEAETAAQQTVIASQAMATKRQQEGYTYQQEKGFEVAKTVAGNEAVGQFTNMGVGLGTMAGVGASVGGMVGNAVSGALGSVTPAPAAAAASQGDDPIAVLGKLKQLLDAGLIAQSDYDTKKAEVLSRL